MDSEDRKHGNRSARTLLGSVNIDTDTLGDYARGYGFPYSNTPDPVYTHGLTRFLDLLAEHGIRATIFVIGRDAEVPEHREILRRAVADGHELANHTYTHPRRLASLPEGELRSEIGRAHDLISELRGAPAVGFRAPCYDVSGRVLDVLCSMNYLYDSSVHPTALTPVIDLAVLAKSGFRVWEARPGTYLHALAPTSPYRPWRYCYWRRGGGGEAFLELPLSAVPIVRLPFYGTFTQATGLGLFRASLRWLRFWRRPLNFHFHAVELLGLSDPGVDPAFAVHPGLSKPADRKRDEIDEMLRLFSDAYELMPLGDMALRILGGRTTTTGNPAPPTRGDATGGDARSVGACPRREPDTSGSDEASLDPAPPTRGDATPGDARSVGACPRREPHTSGSDEASLDPAPPTRGDATRSETFEVWESP